MAILSMREILPPPCAIGKREIGTLPRAFPRKIAAAGRFARGLAGADSNLRRPRKKRPVFDRGECVAPQRRNNPVLLFAKRVYTTFANRPGLKPPFWGMPGEGVDESCVESKETWRGRRARPVLHRQNGGTRGHG